MTALHHACMANATSCVQELLQDPTTVVDSQDISGCTPLLYCLKNKNKDLEKVEWLPTHPSIHLLLVQYLSLLLHLRYLSVMERV